MTNPENKIDMVDNLFGRNIQSPNEKSIDTIEVPKKSGPRGIIVFRNIKIPKKANIPERIIKQKNNRSKMTLALVFGTFFSKKI